MATIEFNVGLYRATHAQQPRGWGCWVFTRQRSPAIADDDEWLWSPARWCQTSEIAHMTDPYRRP